jgi:2-oxoglutarate dehydrogenase E1 component
MWEAQFGDFANGAQVIIDQFIAAGETKWDRVSGLVMLLPHGYEGQGAEHSSARIERYLQLCAANNIQVCYPSTPGQMYHLLRRQMKQPFRKPLIVFTPKSLLRNPRCVSTREELESGHFREVLGDVTSPEHVKTVLLCSGKIYHELTEKRETDQRDDVAIIRIEQYYPLRLDLIKEALALYNTVTNYLWVQEEPRNMGAWNFLQPHLMALLKRDIRYVGRPEAPAPAVGSHKVHHDEQEQLLKAAFLQ